MFLGIDVGGTNTDAVIIDQQEIISKAKISTNHKNLVESVNQVLSRVLKGIDPKKIKRLNLSTTLSTNALLENKTEDVGVLVTAGPGIHPDHFRIGRYFDVIEGSLDHRGKEITPLDERLLQNIIQKYKNDGVKTFAAAGKFGTRNPLHENIIFKNLHESADFITLGHQLSGQLNFPRRIITAYYNSAVWCLYNRFADAVESSFTTHNLDCEVHILKADGGTMPVPLSRKFPVQTIHSGPAASVMGILALNQIQGDAVILDIGGTSTDAAIFVEGNPLLEREGIQLDGRATLVRAIQTKSVGIGGDSNIKYKQNRIEVGPERAGPAMALGGKVPTLVDALNYKGLANLGNRDQSVAGIQVFAEKNRVKADIIVDGVIKTAAEKIRDHVHQMIKKANERPVYTIYELLHEKPIAPEKIYLMGGPAKAISGVLAGAFNMDVIVSPQHDIGNAVGAALSRTTLTVELNADTARGTLIIPSLNIEKLISRDYDLEQAKEDARKYIIEHLKEMDIEDKNLSSRITEAESFNMVEGFTRSGKIIRVRCQVEPGLTNTIRNH